MVEGTYHEINLSFRDDSEGQLAAVNLRVPNDVPQELKKELVTILAEIPGMSKAEAGESAGSHESVIAFNYKGQKGALDIQDEFFAKVAAKGLPAAPPIYEIDMPSPVQIYDGSGQPMDPAFAEHERRLEEKNRARWSESAASSADPAKGNTKGGR